MRWRSVIHARLFNRLNRAADLSGHVFCPHLGEEIIGDIPKTFFCHPSTFSLT